MVKESEYSRLATDDEEKGSEELLLAVYKTDGAGFSESEEGEHYHHMESQV